MATYLNPAIIANSVPETAPPNPAVAAETVARIRQLQQQAALAPIQQQEAQAQLQNTQQDVQTRQLQNTQLQQQVQDQQNFAKSIADSGGDPDKIQAAIDSGAIRDPLLLMRMQGMADQQRRSRALATQAQDQVTLERNQGYFSQLQAVRNAEDPTIKNQLWRGFANSLNNAKNPDGTPLFPAGAINPATVPPDQVLGLYQRYLDRNGQFLQGEITRRKEAATAQQAETTAQDDQLSSFLKAVPTNEADYDKAYASLSDFNKTRVPPHYNPNAIANLVLGQVPPAQRPDVQLKQRALDAMKNFNPNSLQTMVAGAINPSKYPDIYKGTLGLVSSAVSSGLITKPEEIQNLIKVGADKAMELSNETSPAKINADAQRSFLTQRMLKQGTNPDVANVPPGAVSQATSQATKLDNEYNKAKAVTDTIGRAIELAESGNKAAGAAMPIVGAETLNAINGIKRINRQDIEQYGDAGSILDRLKGEIGKVTKGQPIPSNVLEDFRQLHQAVGDQAWQQYTDSLKSLNNRYGSTFQPSNTAPKIYYPSLPSSFSQSDVGKVYRDPRSGQNIRITAVNPGNASQYRGTPISASPVVPNSPVAEPGAAAAVPRNFVRYATGNGGHQIGQTSDGAWYDTQTGAKIQ